MRQLRGQLQWRKIMPKFTLIAEDTDISGKLTGSKSSREFHAEQLEDVIVDFEIFLRGAGYYFRGNLDITYDKLEEIDSAKPFDYPTNHYSNIK